MEENFFTPALHHLKENVPGSNLENKGRHF